MRRLSWRVPAALALVVAVGGSARAQAPSRPLESVLETLDVATGARTVVYRTRDHIEAPNWSRDGAFLIFNGGGRLYRLNLAGGTPTPVDTGDATRLNNDHGLSPDGTLLAVSDQSHGGSAVKVLPAGGGEPRTLTPLTPSYWHGWSPDGATLAFVGERGGNFDIYTVPVAGGPERRLTDDPAPEDGPDYAPDGRIWFNSARTGTMQIWRMNPDGSAQTRITRDAAWADWFPHPSPDGRWVVLLSYSGEVVGHPGEKDVALRLMPADASAPPRVIARLFGGQGTINVPSWSPDSRRIAFVSYRPLN